MENLEVDLHDKKAAREKKYEQVRYRDGQIDKQIENKIDSKNNKNKCELIRLIDSFILTR